MLTDAYGRHTTYVHADGLVTAIHEPEGRSTLKEWYSTTDPLTGAYARSLKKLTDPRGLVTEYKYDAQGNVVETKVTGDLDGDPATPATETHLVTALYNSLNIPEWTADSATGLTTEYFYEDTDYPRLPTRVATKHTATGTPLRTDKFEYTERDATAPPPATDSIFAKGLLEKLTVAHGTPDETVTDYDYDATGFRTYETRRTGTTDPDLTLTYAPTPRREIASITDAANRVTEFTYDALSRPRTRTVKDENGTVLAVTETTYNANGEVSKIDGPRTGPEDWIEHDYDQAGRIAETRALRIQAKADGTGVETPPAPAHLATTRYYHDFFGNLALAIDARGHATTHQYDDLGRLTHTRRFDAAHTPALLAQYEADQFAARAYDGSLPPGVTVLSLETFTHHPGGDVHVHTDVLGGVTTTLYNSRGQPRHRTAPDGTVLQWRYRPDGRLAREILRDGSYWEITYDDVARTVVRTLRKADTTALASETRVYDRRGNLVSLTDAEAGVSTTIYDDLDRVKTVTGPAATATSAQLVATHAYDAAGILHAVTNAANETTLTTRDALGRVVEVAILDASDELVRVTSFDYSADHHSVTSTDGTGPDAIVTTTYTDPTGRVLLARHADATFTRQAYDLGGYLTETRDPLNRVTLTTFNALGHLATTELPDGHLTTFVHNPAGQLLERRMPGPQGTLIAHSTYDTAGRLTHSRLVNGGAETRVYSHTYYPSSHATWPGLLATTTDPRNVVFTRTYDDFLRLHELVTDGPAPETDSTTTHLYDKLGRLTELEQNSPASAAGPPTLVTRTPDAHGRLLAETVALDGAAHADFAQHWNAAGRRSRLIPTVPSPSPAGFTFQHRADGSLSAVSVGGFSATFDYTDAGRLSARQNPWRHQTITERDALGRIEEIDTTLAATSALLQRETQDWRADHTLDAYAVARTAPGAWDESRAYAYDSRGRATSEGFSPAPGESSALASTFDHGSVGLGVRTDQKVATGAPAAWQSRVPASPNIDAFARVTDDETNARGKSIPAAGASLGADYVELWLNGSFQGRADHPGWADNVGAWSKILTLDAGAQNLEARAIHPSGQYTATATSDFTVSAPLVALASAHDAEGNVTGRTFADGRVQTLVWDAFNRLVRVTERDANNDGYDWTAVYDGFGRRLRTTHQPVAANVATGAPAIVASLYDPEVEFLEIAVIVDGEAAWKVFGSDLDGRYGGWNGTGGLEAVLTPDATNPTGAWLVNAVVTDAFGHTVATVSGVGAQQSVTWLSTRVGGYGPLLNHRAEVLVSATRVAESTAWRGRRIDPTGFYWLGARYYDYTVGRFLSPDPYGHGSDMSLYAFANGDPVNRFDPDGRFSKDIWGNPYPAPLSGIDYASYGEIRAVEDRGFWDWQGAVANMRGFRDRGLGLISMVANPIDTYHSFTTIRDPLTPYGSKIDHFLITTKMQLESPYGRGQLLFDVAAAKGISRMQTVVSDSAAAFRVGLQTENRMAFNVSRQADGWVTVAHPGNADAFIQGRVVGSNLEIGMVNVPGPMQGQGLSRSLYQSLTNEARDVSSITGELANTNKMIFRDGLDAGLSVQEAAAATPAARARAAAGFGSHSFDPVTGVLTSTR